MPEEKELVFDIDVTDYADVILEKEETDAMTSLTWHFCAVAIKVVDSILRNDFGFSTSFLYICDTNYYHLTWFF